MPVAAAEVSAEQVRAFRILATALTRSVSSVADLPLWDLGVQDRDGSARQSLGIRLGSPDLVPDVDDPGGAGEYALAWSLRGSPHVHRRPDLNRIAAAVWPADESDAAARLVGDAKRLAGAGAGAMEAYRAVAAAFRAVITAPTVKGEASAALTAALPSRFSGLCAGCHSTHVREMLFRVAALPGGLGLVPSTKPVVLAPLSPAIKESVAQQGQAGMAEMARMVRAYYQLFGTGSATDVAAHLGTSAAAIKRALPDDLVPVTVDGARTLLRGADLDTVRGIASADVSSIVRLLPPGDPLLQPRDRTTLTTERNQQKALWPMIGLPGAVLASGGIAGMWRSRLSGQQLTLTITAWRGLNAAQRRALGHEAELIGAVRGAAQTQLVVEP